MNPNPTATAASDLARLLVADDHEAVRVGVVAFLNAVGGCEIVATAADGHETLAMAKSHAPDLILLDMRMRGPCGPDQILRIRECTPNVKVLPYSGSADAALVGRALAAGASGYVSKEERLGVVQEAVQQVLLGYKYLSPVILDSLGRGARSEGLVRDRAAGNLTEREQTLLVLMAQGLTDEEIANAENLSKYTIRNAILDLKGRLRLRDRSQLVSWVWRNLLSEK